MTALTGNGRGTWLTLEPLTMHGWKATSIGSMTPRACSQTSHWSPSKTSLTVRLILASLQASPQCPVLFALATTPLEAAWVVVHHRLKLGFQHGELIKLVAEAAQVYF